MQTVKQFDLFGQLRVIGDAESKLEDLYNQNPAIFKNTKRVILEFWKIEGLSEVLGDLLPAFESWFLHSSTASETLCRVLRSLKERGVIKLSDEEKEERQEAQELHRKYWSKRKNGDGGQGS